MSAARLRNELYPLGFLGVLLVDTLYKQWVVYFHAPPEARSGPGGVAEALGSASGIGAYLLLGFALQAVCGPWIGQLSDRLRSPWGRRRPVVLAALPLLALCFAATWRGWGPPWLVVPLYCLSFTLVAGPYLTLLPALASEERVRVRMSLTGAVLALVGLGLALIGGPRLLDAAGFPALAWVGLAALGLTVLPAALALREAPPAGPPPPGGLAGYAHELREVLGVPGLARFLIGNGLFQGGFAALVIVAPFVTEALLRAPRAATGRLNGVLFLGMLLTIPGVGVTRRWLAPGGQIRLAAAAGALVLGALGLLSWRGSGEPSFLAWSLGFGCLGLPAMAGMALPPVILSAYADADGRDRQGAVFGLNGGAINLGNALAALLTTALLGLGNTAQDPRGVLAVVGGVAATFALAALVFPTPPRRGEVEAGAAP